MDLRNRFAENEGFYEHPYYESYSDYSEFSNVCMFGLSSIDGIGIIDSCSINIIEIIGIQTSSKQESYYTNYELGRLLHTDN